MLYDTIKRALSTRLASGEAPAAIVAAPYTRAIISAVMTALESGFLCKAILVGDPSAIPLTEPYDKDRVQMQPCASEAAMLDHIRHRLSDHGGQVVIKGNISSGKLLRAVLAASPNKSDRLSHIYVIDSKAFPDRAIIFSDAGVNIAPDLETKAQIIDNAARLARNIGYVCPRIALLCAVETPNPAMPSTVEAQALRTMGQNGRFPDCHVDGPLAIDAAMIPRSAATKSLSGEVAGRADILICPNIDSANTTAKALIGATGRAMGVVYGCADMPIAFPSRGDSEQTILDSILLAASLTRPTPGTSGANIAHA